MAELPKNENKYYALSAIHPYIQTNIVDGTETDVKKDFIGWGKNNDYPDYLFSLYKDCPTLQAIINGAVDYSCGDEITLNLLPYGEKINDKGETPAEVVKNCFLDYWTYGAFALNVVRNKLGGIAAVYYLPVLNIRSDKKNEFFYYSDDWGKSFGRVKYLTYPKFRPDGVEANSILYVKRTYNGTYPIPVYAAAVKAAEIEKSIDDYHLNAIKNSFNVSAIINFNNGIPSEEVQNQINEDIQDKFTGEENVARFLVAFNNSKDNAVTVETLDGNDWGVKYESLAARSRQALFTAFRCNPNIMGIPTENLGFSTEEYNSAFKLFNKTMILPSQRLMCDAFAKVFGEECLTISPFVIDFDEEGTESQAKTIE